MIECKYSFYDLFRAAYKKEPTIEEIAHFENLSQEEKNDQIKVWAHDADWDTQDIQGDDGVMYRAFAPTFNPEEVSKKLSQYGIKQ